MDMEVGFFFIYFTLNTEPSLKGMSDTVDVSTINEKYKANRKEIAKYIRTPLCLKVF